MGSGLRKYTELLKPPLAELRLDYVKIAAYIDLITAYSFDICFKNVWKCFKPLVNLGFVVHPKKSDFAPSQEIKYLRFIINSVTKVVRLRT